MNRYNENNNRHGYWESYHPNGKLWTKGNYINGIPDGKCEIYDSNGNLWYKKFYI